MSGVEAVNAHNAPETSVGDSGTADGTNAEEAEDAALAALVEILDKSFPPAQKPVVTRSSVAEGQASPAPARRGGRAVGLADA